MKTPKDNTHPVAAHRFVATAKRYSSEGQDPMSNEIQDRKITEFLTRNAPEAEVLMTWEDVDSAWSGTRRQLEEIHARLKRHNAKSRRRITLLLLLNWNRFFRNMKLASRWILRFEEIGVQINTVERWLDPDNPEDQIMRAFELYQAQKYSDQVSANICRGIEERHRRGVYCHNIPKRFLQRVYYDIRRYTIKAVEPAFSASRAAGLQVIAGVPYSKAYRLHGGREVLGPLSTWWAMLGKELAKGEYKGKRMDMPAMFTPPEWAGLQAIRAGNLPDAPTLTKDTDFDTFLTHGVLRCAKCGGLLTTSRPKSRNGTYHHYHVCGHEYPRHYRLRAGEVTAEALTMLDELSLSAEAQAAVTAETKRLAEADRKQAQANLNGLKKELAKLTQGFESATLKNAMGDFSDAQLRVVEKAYLDKQAEVARAEDVVSGYADILAIALASLNDLGTLIKGSGQSEQTNAFLAMLFPDGLFFEAETGIFRTSSMNAAFTRNGWGSGDYDKIKLGGTPPSGVPPVVWRIPESNR